MPHSFSTPSCPLTEAVKTYYKNLLSKKTLSKQRELAGKHPYRLPRGRSTWKDSWKETLENEGYEVVFTPLSVLIYIKWDDD